MSRYVIAFAFVGLLLSACQLPLGDRVLQVKVSPVSTDGVGLRGCDLSLRSADDDRILETKSDIRPEFLSSFVNPPIAGDYYFSIACPGKKPLATDKRNFARGPFLIDLGEVVIGL